MFLWIQLRRGVFLHQLPQALRNVQRPRAPAAIPWSASPNREKRRILHPCLPYFPFCDIVSKPSKRKQKFLQTQLLRSENLNHGDDSDVFPMCVYPFPCRTFGSDRNIPKGFPPVWQQNTEKTPLCTASGGKYSMKTIKRICSALLLLFGADFALWGVATIWEKLTTKQPLGLILMLSPDCCGHEYALAGRPAFPRPPR